MSTPATEGTGPRRQIMDLREIDRLEAEGDIATLATALRNIIEFTDEATEGARSLALSRAATGRGYRLREERFHLADATLIETRAEVAAELRRVADELHELRQSLPLESCRCQAYTAMANYAGNLHARADELDPQGGA